MPISSSSSWSSLSSSSLVAALLLFLSKTWIVFIFLSATLPVATSVPSQSLNEATQVLSNSGFVSMSLTLRLLSKPLGLSSSRFPSLTVFSPPDRSFSLSSQPSLSLLRLHFAPLSLPFDTLHSLPFGTKIPTLDPDVSLTVAAPSPFPGDYSFKILLNGVEVIGSPVFDDGYLTVYGIDDFLDPNFNVPPPAPSPSPTASGEGCTVNVDASNGDLTLMRQLRETGHSLVASFLGMQLGGLKDHKITVFAPRDEGLANLTGNLGKIGSVFLRHVLPCRITGRDLGDFGNGTVIGMSFEGSSMEVTISGDDKEVMVNGAVVNAPDMWENEWISVHGLSGVLAEKPTR